MCEPIAFQGVFLGATNPDPETLRVAVGRGLTGWVAAHGEIGPARRRLERPAHAGRPLDRRPGVDAPRADDVRGTVHGVDRHLEAGRDRFDADDETTLSIFAGYAAQALVNAHQLERLHRQQAELEHQLDSQRRLLEVNERLLSTLDPAGVLDIIADSLKAIVPVRLADHLPGRPSRGVRRAVIARDRFAESILAHESPLGIGITGWVIDHGEARPRQRGRTSTRARSRSRARRSSRSR